MRRRDFISIACGAAAWPGSAFSQLGQSRPRRIGVLIGVSKEDPQARPRAEAFEKGLVEQGWNPGINLQVDFRWSSDNPDQLKEFARELVALRPEVLVTNATPATRAVRRETIHIPVVFVLVTEPIAGGFVASHAVPGGNTTGLTTFEPSTGAKWVQLLKEIVPRTERTFVLFNPKTLPHSQVYIDPLTHTASKLDVRVFSTPVSTSREIELALGDLAREKNGGFIVLPDIFITNNRDLICENALRHRLPGVFQYRYFAASGGLVSYGIDVLDVFRRSASFVDKILRGADVSTLPVQQPTKYEMIVNLKTARLLGIEIPQVILARADEFIE